ncbi:Rhomboid-Related Protein 3 [Manis pentadactyla]|nr:Rhomboid-Related Protein 3 [Manis pentadactyla]
MATFSDPVADSIERIWKARQILRSLPGPARLGAGPGDRDGNGGGGGSGFSRISLSGARAAGAGWIPDRKANGEPRDKTLGQPSPLTGSPGGIAWLRTSACGHVAQPLRRSLDRKWEQSNPSCCVVAFASPQGARRDG